jgi:hypothetical protein
MVRIYPARHEATKADGTGIFAPSQQLGFQQQEQHEQQQSSIQGQCADVVSVDLKPYFQAQLQRNTLCAVDSTP